MDFLSTTLYINYSVWDTSWSNHTHFLHRFYPAAQDWSYTIKHSSECVCVHIDIYLWKWDAAWWCVLGWEISSSSPSVSLSSESSWRTKQKQHAVKRSCLGWSSGSRYKTGERKMFDLNVKLRTHAPFQTCSQRLGLDDVTGSRRPVSTPLDDSTVTELKLQFALNGHSTFKKVREVRLVVCFFQDRSLIVRWVWHLSNSNMYMKRRLEDQVE